MNLPLSLILFFGGWSAYAVSFFVLNVWLAALGCVAGALGTAWVGQHVVAWMERKEERK